MTTIDILDRITSRTTETPWLFDAPSYAESEPAHVRPNETINQTVADATSSRSETAAMGDSRTPASRVSAAKRRSGLTWDQMSRAFGVSMRAAQGWAAGDRMATRNLERLARIELLLEQHGTAPPDRVRVALLSPTPGGGRPPYALLLDEIKATRTHDSQRAWKDRN